MKIIVITSVGHGFPDVLKQYQEQKKLDIEFYESLSKGLDEALSRPPEALLVHDDLVSNERSLRSLSSGPAGVPLIVVSEYCNEKTLSKYENIPVFDFLYLPLWSGALDEVLDEIAAFWEAMGRKSTQGDILVVDDDKGVLETTCEILREEGYSVKGASNGKTAIELVKKHRFDLVITDVRMEGMSGIEVMKRIKKMHPMVQVVVFTAYADIDTAIEAVQAGAYDYIRKPFKVENLMEITRKAVNIKKLMEDNLNLSRMKESSKHALKRRHYEMDVINEFNRRAALIHNPEELTVELLNNLFRIIDYDFAALVLASDFQSMYYRFVDINPYLGSEEMVKSILEKIPALAGTINIDELSVVNLSHEKETARKATLQGKHILPLGSHENPIGALFIGRISPSPYSDTEKNIILNIASSYGLLIGKIQALKAREQIQLRAVIAEMTNGIIMTDVHGSIMVLNESAKEILSIQRSGDPRTLKNLDSGRNCDFEKTISNMEKEKINNLSKEIYLTVPKEIVINLDITRVLDEKGNVLGYIHLLRDITELKEIDRMKSEFVSVVSHEMRTPLTTMKNSVAIILKETAGSINEVQKKFLTMAQDSIDRLTRLIGSLLDLSKIEAGKIILNKSRLDVRKILTFVMESMVPLSQSRNVSFELVSTEKNLHIYADKDRFEQVVTNLMHNALKYSAQGEKVEIAFGRGNRNDIPEEFREHCPKDPAYVEISVRDHGIGISPEYQKAIFDKFQQAESTLKREMGGIGLGLAISRGIIHAHHGALWVESAPGEGSTFRVLIPKDTRKIDSKGR